MDSESASIRLESGLGSPRVQEIVRESTKESRSPQSNPLKNPGVQRKSIGIRKKFQESGLLGLQESGVRVNFTKFPTPRTFPDLSPLKSGFVDFSGL